MASSLEIRFLMLCLPPVSNDRSDRIDPTPFLPALHWPALLDRAFEQGMMPLLAYHLLPSSSRPAHPAVPEQVLASLRSYKEQHLFRTINQTAALVELQREFDRAGIRVLPWKGPSVGQLLYGAATLRESADLDFLFLEKDIPKVLEITQRLGYMLLGSSDSESKDIYILTLQREFTFARKRDRSMLEFHLQVMPSRFTLWQDSAAEIERASAACSFGGIELRMQRPEDLLISLCAHATKHYWDKLKWSCDIVQFLRVYGSSIDWQVFLGDLRRTRKDGVVLLGMAVAERLYAVDLPEQVQSALRDAPGIVSFAVELTDHLASDPPVPITRRQRTEMIALLCPRLRDRVAYKLLPIVELNYEDLWIPVGSPFFFLNYVYRVVRLLRKYGAHRLIAKTAVSTRSVH